MENSPVYHFYVVGIWKWGREKLNETSYYPAVWLFKSDLIKMFTFSLVAFRKSTISLHL